jgi:hypothetical protein
MVPSAEHGSVLAVARIEVREAGPDDLRPSQPWRMPPGRMRSGAISMLCDLSAGSV